MLDGTTASVAVENVLDEVYKIRDGSGVGLGLPNLAPGKRYLLLDLEGFDQMKWMP